MPDKINNRKGFLLPVVLAFLIIILFLTGTRLYVSRHNLNITERLSDRERAYQLAASGLEVAKIQIDNCLSFINNPSKETFPKKEKAPPEISPLINELLTEYNLPNPDGAGIILESPYFKFIKGASDATELLVSLELTKGNELYKEGSSSLAIDQKELEHMLMITAFAEVGKSKCKVTTFKRLKVVNITPPVIGKFTFFIHNLDKEEINSIDDSISPEKTSNTPLSIHNGTTASTASLSPEEWVKMIDGQGWIYGGSQNSANPIILGASMAGGNENFEEGLLKTNIFTYPVENGSYLDRGDTISYYASQSPLYQELGETEKQEMLKLQDANKYKKSSIVNFFGSKNKPSPTIVIGNIYRRWALVQGLKNNQRNTMAPLPFLDETSFSKTAWPGNTSSGTIEAIKKHFENSFENYKERMSNIIEEPFNQSNLTSLLFPDDDIKQTMIITDQFLNEKAVKLPSSELLFSYGSQLPLYKTIEQNTVTIKNNAGDTLADDCNLEELTDYSFLRNKAATIYETFANFIDDRKGFGPTGVVIINSDIKIAKHHTIKEGTGGIIISTGNITISNSISSTSGEPLSLVALSGNINLDTSKKIEAALIALAGEITISRECEINGLIAANNLKISKAVLPATRTLTYNKRLDPTDNDNYQRNYRISCERRWKSFVH